MKLFDDTPRGRVDFSLSSKLADDVRIIMV